MKGIQVFKILGVLITLLAFVSATYAASPTDSNPADGLNDQSVSDLSGLSDQSGYSDDTGATDTGSSDDSGLDDGSGYLDDTGDTGDGSWSLDDGGLDDTGATDDGSDGSGSLDDAGATDDGSGSLDDGGSDDSGVVDGSSDVTLKDIFYTMELATATQLNEDNSGSSDNSVTDYTNTDDSDYDYMHYEDPGMDESAESNLSAVGGNGGRGGLLLTGRGGNGGNGGDFVGASSTEDPNNTSTIPMKNTGLPVLPALIGVLSIIGGVMINKRS